MAKISEIVSQATPQYQATNLNQFGRDINNIVQKLNTTYPQDIKEETEAVSYFLND
jgi:hypothetical protein|tara:strand:+ start:2032 stop:2199 length:168 start_codon:yes stop_codon:yes gene_type:complete